MSNLHDARPARKTIILTDGVEREIRFTLNAMAELEDRYGSVDAAFAEMNKGSIKAIRFVLWAALIEGSPELTERQVGSLIDTQYLQQVMDTMTEALGEDNVAPEDGGNAALPNA